MQVITLDQMNTAARDPQNQKGLVLQSHVDLGAAQYDLQTLTRHWPNLVVRGRASEIYYPEHFGRLSIKCVFVGQEVYECEGRQVAVDDHVYLLLNHEQHSSCAVQSRTEVEFFAVFFRRVFVEDF